MNKGRADGWPVATEKHTRRLLLGLALNEQSAATVSPWPTSHFRTSSTEDPPPLHSDLSRTNIYAEKHMSEIKEHNLKPGFDFY